MTKAHEVVLNDFDYVLPQELIAQNALIERANARLLVLERKTGAIQHKTFRDLPEYFESGDVLVLNNTKVLPARLFVNRKTGGRVEILVLSHDENTKEARVLLKPSRRVHRDEELFLDSGEAFLSVLDEADHETGIRHVRFLTIETIEKSLERLGKIPLPPYIDRAELPVDRTLYQTVFAANPGAVASPTAGLHFDEALLAKLEEKGVQITFVTLHVGYGTFQPVQVEDLSKHKMHEEYFEVPDETAEIINFAKLDARPITACGTTVIRTLESSTRETLPPECSAQNGFSRLFIYPPYEFKIADRMITNFHLPKSTLLMLTSAFAGHEFLMRAYKEAIRERYRFYSYGDAMLII